MKYWRKLTKCSAHHAETWLIVTQRGQYENMKVMFLKTKTSNVKILPNAKFSVYKLDCAWPPNQTLINTNTTPFDLIALFSLYLTSKFRYFKIQSSVLNAPTQRFPRIYLFYSHSLFFFGSKNGNKHAFNWHFIDRLESLTNHEMSTLPLRI